MALPTRRLPIPASACYAAAAITLALGYMFSNSGAGVFLAIPGAAVLWALGRICADLARIADALDPDAAPPDAP